MKSQLLQSCQGCAPSIYKPHPSLPKGGRSTSTLISTLHMRKTKRIRHIVYNRFVPSPLRETQRGTSRWPPAPWGGFGEGPLLAAVFVPAKAGLFERPKAAFFYRRGGWRHAVHDGGDGGDDTEENSFSDWRHHRTHQGEAAIRRHGFLCLCQPIIEVSINGFPPQLALHKQQQH